MEDAEMFVVSVPENAALHLQVMSQLEHRTIESYIRHLILTDMEDYQEACDRCDDDDDCNDCGCD